MYVYGRDLEQLLRCMWTVVGVCRNAAENKSMGAKWQRQGGRKRLISLAGKKCRDAKHVSCDVMVGGSERYNRLSRIARSMVTRKRGSEAVKQ